MLRQSDTHIKFSIMAYSIPTAMVTLWRPFRASFPPALRRAVAQAPSVKAQKIRWTIGGSGFPLAERQSIMREPLSELVTKFRTALIRETILRKPPRLSPYCCITSKYIWLSVLHDKRNNLLYGSLELVPPNSEEQFIPSRVASRSIFRPAPPNMVNHKKR